MKDTLRARHEFMVRRHHRIGATGLTIVLIVMALASAVTGDWSVFVPVLLAVSAAGSAAAFGAMTLLGMTGSRWSLLLWPAAAMSTLARLHAHAPTASALLAGVIVLSFLFVGLTMARGASLLLLPGAVFVVLHTAELTVSAALVRIPIAIGIWVVVAELPARLLADLRAKEAELRRRAGTDSLTGALNRTDLDRSVDQLGPQDAVALIDLDHFKLYNDEHGHIAGDVALAEFAKVLMDNTRSSDSVFRYGGEEFLVTFPGATIAQASELLDRIRQQWSATGLGLSFSAGLAPASEGVINRADHLLYDAKDRGRAQVVAEGATTA